MRTRAGRYAERCLWANNGPHPNVKPEPGNGALLAWALQSIESEATRRKIFADSPGALRLLNAAVEASPGCLRCHARSADH